MHLVLDSMWETPQTLFWPLLGWRFPASTESSWTGWIANMFEGLKHDPVTYIPEVIGFFIVVGVISVLIKDREKILNSKIDT